jgi:hypothetical protein
MMTHLVTSLVDVWRTLSIPFANERHDLDEASLQVRYQANPSHPSTPPQQHEMPTYTNTNNKDNRATLRAILDAPIMSNGIKVSQ